MFCINCGTQLPDDAKFCFKCGKPQDSGTRTGQPSSLPESVRFAKSPDTSIETCEIFWKETHQGWTGRRGIFYAEAISSQGKYTLTQSVLLENVDHRDPPGDKPQHNDAHKSLIQALINDGWHPTGERGVNWWNTRFRREFNPQRAESEDVQIEREVMRIIVQRNLFAASEYYQKTKNVSASQAFKYVSEVYRRMGK